MDRWHTILTKLLEHDETQSQHHGSILSGPLITMEMALRIDGNRELGPLLTSLGALVRRGLVERAPNEDLVSNTRNWLGRLPWSYAWRLTAAGRDRAAWPLAPKLRPPRAPKFPSFLQLADAKRDAVATWDRVKVALPEGVERDEAFTILVRREREIVELRFRKLLAAARSPRRKDQILADLTREQKSWEAQDQTRAEQRRQLEENYDELVRLGLEKPVRKLLPTH